MRLEDESRRLRMNSVSASTLKARHMQWGCYLQACQKFGWVPMPCGVQQACSYVTYLARRLAYTSVLAYYQAIIFFHTCEGLSPVRFANPALQATLNGIKRLGPSKPEGKDPLLPHHLERLAKVIDTDIELEFLVFVAALVMFRTLLRVSHVITSEHTLLRSDLMFNDSGCLLLVRSSKTCRKGSFNRYIPIVKANNKKVCAATWLKALVNRFPAVGDAPLFSSSSVDKLSYSNFSKVFKSLLVRAGLEGNFASHSLRGGGATFMSMMGCTVTEIKSRGNWVSDCMYRYVKHPLSHSVKVDQKIAGNC